MKQNPILLGIDIGTSACKVAAFQMDGTVAASADSTYPVYYPKTGYVEQDCEEWWAGVCHAIRSCLSHIDAKNIAGIGVDGQSWSCIPLDKNGEVLYHTPIWMDMRSTDICMEIENTIGTDRIFEISKNPFQPSYTTPKIIWFEKNLPEIYKKTVYFLQSNSYIVYRLTNIISQDRSQCYGLHVYDMEKGRYDRSLCKELNIDSTKLPPIYECDQVVGTVTKEASAVTGLPEGIPVVAGGLDAACGTLGAGVYKSGQTQEQGGQAGGMSICVDQPVGDRRLILGNHVVPGMWLLQGGTIAGGASYKWIGETIGQYEFYEGEKAGKSPWQIMDHMAARINPGSDGVIFLPYLSGERSPIWDSNASGMFFGLTFDKTKEHLYRAVMEGAAYALRHNLDTAKSAGVSVESMNAIGGAAKSSIWTQIKADITGVEIHVPKSDTATTLGAVMLAGVGVGIYKDYDEAVRKTIHIEKKYFPNPKHKAIYDKYYELYLELYKDNKEIMKRQKEIVCSSVVEENT